MYGQNDGMASFSRVEQKADCATETRRLLRPFKGYDSLCLYYIEPRVGCASAGTDGRRLDHNRDYITCHTYFSKSRGR